MGPAKRPAFCRQVPLFFTRNFPLKHSPGWQVCIYYSLPPLGSCLLTCLIWPKECGIIVTCRGSIAARREDRRHLRAEMFHHNTDAAVGTNFCFEAMKRFASTNDILIRRHRAAIRSAVETVSRIEGRSSRTEGGNVVASKATLMPRRTKRAEAASSRNVSWRRRQ